MRLPKELSPLAVSRLTEPGFHRVGGVTGLYLQINDRGARSWVLRMVVGTKRRELGLGGFPTVGLADARTKARAVRDQVENGLDPIAEKRKKREMLIAEQRRPTFKKCAEQFMAMKSAEWRNDKHRQQWVNTLNQYAYPTIGDLPVHEISQRHVLTILEPIWTVKTETANRVRGRIENVLDWATAHGERTGVNPARWRGQLDKLLPSPKKIAKVVHHPALPYEQLAEFQRRLNQYPSISAKALGFAILTAARSGEVRGATWEEIDFAKRIWTVPADRMKGGKEHRVPLSRRAIALLKTLPPQKTGIVFATQKGNALSDMALTMLLRGVWPGITAHGFRSTFRDWAAEQTSFPREVCEQALAHALPNQVEAAYRRSDLFDKRRELMDQWAAFCRKKPLQTPNKEKPTRKPAKSS